MAQVRINLPKGDSRPIESGYRWCNKHRRFEKNFRSDKSAKKELLYIEEVLKLPAEISTKND